MKNENYLERLLGGAMEFIAGIAWRVYLWGARMTEAEFLAAHRRQAIEQIKDNPPTCPYCGGEDWHHTTECYLGL